MSGSADAAPGASAGSGAPRRTPPPSSPGTTDGTRLAADPSSTSPDATTGAATLPDVARTPPPPRDPPAASTPPARGSPLTPDERAGLDLIETLAERATEEMAVLRRELASERARVAAYAAELARIRAATEARLTRGFESVSDAVDRVKSSAEASDATRREAAAELERAREQRGELERRAADAERREAETREALRRERRRTAQLVAALNAVRDGADREMRERDATSVAVAAAAAADADARVAAAESRAEEAMAIAEEAMRNAADTEAAMRNAAGYPRRTPGGGRRVAPSANFAAPVASPTRVGRVAAADGSSPAGGARARRCAACEARRAGPGGDLAAITRWCATCDEDATAAGAGRGTFGTGIRAATGIRVAATGIHVAGTGSASSPPPPRAVSSPSSRLRRGSLADGGDGARVSASAPSDASPSGAFLRRGQSFAGAVRVASRLSAAERRAADADARRAVELEEAEKRAEVRIAEAASDAERRVAEAERRAREAEALALETSTAARRETEERVARLEAQLAAAAADWNRERMLMDEERRERSPGAEARCRRRRERREIAARVGSTESRLSRLARPKTKANESEMGGKDKDGAARRGRADDARGEDAGGGKETPPEARSENVDAGENA